jgi:heme-degrading monooxygenase HmoA
VGGRPGRPVRTGLTAVVFVFEVHPAAGKKDEYLALAKHLKPILEGIDGFIDNERFGSLRRPGWILSLSTWRDEKAVVRWRSQGEHHRIQEQGRNHVFSDYRLRVCEVTSDSHPPAGLEVREQRFDETAVGTAKGLGITELSPARDGSLVAPADRIPSHLGLDTQASALVDHDVFESIYNPGKVLLLSAWNTQADAQRWRPQPSAAALRHRALRNVREYGMFERREAAQYYPDAARPRTSH